MDSDQAWVRATGGLTNQDDTLVVAIVDDGFELNHEDLIENRWINHREIPNNNIDDDQNGYVDDYLGWNPLLASDEVAGGSHGTQVSGIIGAVGDNQKGVVGVNWDVKMMMIRNDFNTTEASVLASYGYAYNARKRYNESNGEDGHFVVATNSSWGVDFGQVSDSPLWCSMYDSLGRVGILSIGATANNAVNVDSVGDLPTTCPSDYLISVTNINKLGNYTRKRHMVFNILILGLLGEEVFTTNYPIHMVFLEAPPHLHHKLRVQ